MKKYIFAALSAAVLMSGCQSVGEDTAAVNAAAEISQGSITVMPKLTDTEASDTEISVS